MPYTIESSVWGKNQTRHGKPMVWLVTVIDDYSRTICACYQAANSATVWMDTIRRAMRKGEFGEPDAWSASGIPERIYTDQGFE